MIISASYRTDIPAFYGEWFIRRLNAGYCKTVNPRNHKISRVNLDRSSVDGFVFWTKNVGPFLNKLDEVAQRGYPFVVQHTINGYPRELERAVTPAARSIENVQRIVESFGKGRVVWRYDTIVYSSLTPRSFHEENFGRIADALNGMVDEVVISFMSLYEKTRRNLSESALRHSFQWEDPTTEEKRDLAHTLVSVAQSNGIQLSVCSQRDYLVPGATEARCIDARRLASLGAGTISIRQKGNRPECACSEARDIGEYNTCPQGCVYCYAVTNSGLAKSRHDQHDPESPFLFAPPAGATESEHTSLDLPLFKQEL